MALIPLRRRDGSLRAYALVDAADHGWLMESSWHLNSSGYAVATVRGRKVRMARLILGLKAGDKRQADHVNGDRLDNRRANLRAVSHAENQHNRTGQHRRNKSGYRGVSWRADRAKWVAHVRLDGRMRNLGEYNDPAAAARAASAFRASRMPASADARRSRPDAV